MNLDIKNMEYMNLDTDSEEKKREGDGSESSSSTATAAAEEPVVFPEGETVDGFVFSTLLERRPELGAGLAGLRRELLDASAEGGGEMKVWKMKDLGLQATTVITADKDPLKRLMALAQNFPAHASFLSRVKVPRELRDQVKRNGNSPIFR